MRITVSTDLGQLAEMMGADATREQAEAMLWDLLRQGVTDTDHLIEQEWNAIMDYAIRTTNPYPGYRK